MALLWTIEAGRSSAGDGVGVPGWREVFVMISSLSATPMSPWFDRVGLNLCQITLQRGRGGFAAAYRTSSH